MLSPVVEMSDTELQFARLFQNASEGDAKAPIMGLLPDWFLAKKAKVIYNGPVGLWDHEKLTANHWFDGLSILTSFKVDGSNKMVEMKKRYLKSDAYDKAKAHGKLIITEYGTAGATDPDKSLVSKLVSSLIPGKVAFTSPH